MFIDPRTSCNHMGYTFADGYLKQYFSSSNMYVQRKAHFEAGTKLTREPFGFPVACSSIDIQFVFHL